MNAKIYNGNVQPNPKEYKIWVNDEGIIKTWNGTKWVESTSGGCGSESGGSSNIYPTKYYKVLDSSVIDKNLLVWLSGCYINELNLGSCTSSFVMENESYYQYVTKISFNPVNDYNGVLCHSIEELVHNDENVLSKLESITEEQFYSLE